jgi:hypothetical protein
MSIPADTPADVTTPSSTKRGADSTTAVGSIVFSRSKALQCVVA